EVFPLIRPYWTFMFSFGLPWGFVIASRKEDPLELDEERIKERMRERKIEGLKYYHSGLHRGLFALPLYLIDGLEKGKILTDHDPYIWEL
ncbi:MAG: spermidine synthase, partial [Candidatus Aminicenantes bacterium]|nr:spermidine synthase [Candidatus Aminicenantes bacterium]